MLVKTLKDKDSRIMIWRMDESLEKFEKLTLKSLAEIELECYKKIKSERRKKEWLTSRFLVKKALNLKNNVQIKYDENGKPVLDDFKISISHSDDFVAIILNEKQEVGIDIQKISEKTKKIAHKFISDEEKAMFGTTDKKITTLLWSIKETAYKVYGKKKLPFIDGIKIQKFSPFESNQAEVLINDEQKVTVRFEFLGDYVLVYSC